MNNKGLYIQLFSIHGLVRGCNLELGQNADTGGQVKYVVELARALGRKPGVERVDLITRTIKDKRYSADYAQHVESLSDNVRIVRIRCGGGKYIRKELLWPHLDEFVDRMLKFIKGEKRIPDIVHGHYADAGYVAMQLANLLEIPFVFTGHSLGRIKKARLAQSGMTEEEMNRKFRIDHRIGVEEEVISHANLVVTSTRQEVNEQYGAYDARALGKYSVIPPGVDVAHFFPFYETSLYNHEEDEKAKQASYFKLKELERFLTDMNKPLILALSRPAKKKNIAGLLTAYGQDKELQAIANLAVFAGIRKDISDMDENEQEVLTELLLLMDKFDLYGKLAIPKKHDFEYEVPALYRIAASKGGVFVNPAFTEPFGLTLIEAAATGLPIVTTDDGGPRDIIDNCKNGLLVNVNESQVLAKSIKRLLIEPERWKSCSNNGVEGVRKHYAWNTHCENYLKQLDVLPVSNQKYLEVSKQPSRIGKRLIALKKIFVTDIDNTLLGDEIALDSLQKMLSDQRDVVGFGVATGRTIDSAVEVLEKHKIPSPDLIISSVGSEIYYGSERMQDNGWRTHISSHWQRDKIVDLLSSFKFLELQEEGTQRDFKISYYMAKSSKNMARIHQLLAKNRLRYNLIYSDGQFLDILPERASKGKAVRYLCYKWNILLDRVLVAGDSGNDAEMLRGSMLGVVVGNHSEDLEKLRGLQSIYFSPLPYAAGILDGLYHYHFLNGAEWNGVQIKTIIEQKSDYVNPRLAAVE